jgi:predicted phosphodiesterase
MKTLLLSDIHGNWPALQAVLAAEPDADQFFCLGDLVGYGPQSAECVAWAMQLCPPSRVIQGNHDRAFAGLSPHCAPADPPLAEAMQTATSRLLTPEMKRFLEALHPLEEFRCGETACVAYHYHTADGEAGIHQFGEYHPKWAWETDIILRGHPDRLFVLVGHPDLLLLAHSHAPQTMHWGSTQVVNPGSVGWPADGDPRAAYAIWEDGEVTLRRAEYDVQATVRAFERLALQEQLKQLLVDGLRTGRRLVACPPAAMVAREEAHAAL